MTFIDTHAHLYDEQFAADRATTLQRAAQQGVGQIWLPNCDHTTVAGLLALAEQHPDRCVPMMGLHPTYVSATFEDELARVRHQLDERAFAAVGEIGLDFYWDMTYVPQQIEALRTQLRWAAQANQFVSLHTRSGHDRNAFAETADVLEQLWATTPGLAGPTGIFHCFVGTLAEARRAIELGFLLGIGGVATFKNGGLDQVLPYVGLDHIVLETDSPYLAPVPYRGKRNEPAYVPLVARRVAELTGTTEAEVAERTTANATRLLAAHQPGVGA